MRLSPTGLKILKIVHLLGAACWLGGAVSILTVNIISANIESPAMLYGLNSASHAIDVWIVVNCGVYVCLLTGLIYGLCTPFGFFKFRWQQIKWLITCFCFLSGWFLLGNWEGEMLALSKTMALAQSDHAYTLIRLKHFYFSLLQIALLITIFIVSVYKPGKRKTPAN